MILPATFLSKADAFCNLPVALAEKYKNVPFAAIQFKWDDDKECSSSSYIGWIGGISSGDSIELPLSHLPTATNTPVLRNSDRNSEKNRNDVTARTSSSDSIPITPSNNPNNHESNNFNQNQNQNSVRINYNYIRIEAILTHLEKADEIYFSPLSAYDWDIISTQAEIVENKLLTQLSIAYTGQIIKIQISTSLSANVKCTGVKTESSGVFSSSSSSSSSPSSSSAASSSSSTRKDAAENYNNDYNNNKSHENNENNENYEENETNDEENYDENENESDRVIVAKLSANTLAVVAPYTANTDRKNKTNNHKNDKNNYNNDNYSDSILNNNNNGGSGSGSVSRNVSSHGDKNLKYSNNNNKNNKTIEKISILKRIEEGSSLLSLRVLPSIFRFSDTSYTNTNTENINKKDKNRSKNVNKNDDNIRGVSTDIGVRSALKTSSEDFMEELLSCETWEEEVVKEVVKKDDEKYLKKLKHVQNIDEIPYSKSTDEYSCFIHPSFLEYSYLSSFELFPTEHSSEDSAEHSSDFEEKKALSLPFYIGVIRTHNSHINKKMENNTKDEEKEKGKEKNSEAVIQSVVVSIRVCKYVRPFHISVPENIRKLMNIGDFSQIELRIKGTTNSSGNSLKAPIMPYMISLHPVSWRNVLDEMENVPQNVLESSPGKYAIDSGSGSGSGNSGSGSVSGASDSGSNSNSVQDVRHLNIVRESFVQFYEKWSTSVSNNNKSSDDKNADNNNSNKYDDNDDSDDNNYSRNKQSVLSTLLVSPLVLCDGMIITLRHRCESESQSSVDKNNNNNNYNQNASNNNLSSNTTNKILGNSHITRSGHDSLNSVLQREEEDDIIAVDYLVRIYRNRNSIPMINRDKNIEKNFNFDRLDIGNNDRKNEKNNDRNDGRNRDGNKEGKKKSNINNNNLNNNLNNNSNNNNNFNNYLNNIDNNNEFIGEYCLIDNEETVMDCLDVMDLGPRRFLNYYGNILQGNDFSQSQLNGNKNGSKYNNENSNNRNINSNRNNNYSNYNDKINVRNSDYNTHTHNTSQHTSLSLFPLFSPQKNNFSPPPRFDSDRPFISLKSLSRTNKTTVPLLTDILTTLLPMAVRESILLNCNIHSHINNNIHNDGNINDNSHTDININDSTNTDYNNSNTNSKSHTNSNTHSSNSGSGSNRNNNSNSNSDTENGNNNKNKNKNNTHIHPVPPLGSILIGSKLSGKTALCSGISEFLRLSCKTIIHTQYLDCRTLKGKSTREILDQILELFEIGKINAPSFLCLDNLDILCPTISENNNAQNNFSTPLQQRLVTMLLIKLLRDLSIDATQKYGFALESVNKYKSKINSHTNGIDLGVSHFLSGSVYVLATG